MGHGLDRKVSFAANIVVFYSAHTARVKQKRIVNTFFSAGRDFGSITRGKGEIEKFSFR